MTLPRYRPTQQQLKANEARTFLLCTGNIVLCLTVFIAVGMDIPQDVDKGLRAYFLWMEVPLILAYLFMAGWDAIARVAEEIAGDTPNGNREWTPAPLNRLVPIWLVVELNFIPIAYLIHETGGPASSPYIAIPPTMLLIGQLLKKGGGENKRGLVFPVISYFWLFLLIGMLFYLGLILWEALTPTDHQDMNTTVATAIITFGLYFVATWTNYFSLSRNFRNENRSSNSNKTSTREHDDEL